MISSLVFCKRPFFGEGSLPGFLPLLEAGVSVFGVFRFILSVTSAVAARLAFVPQTRSLDLFGVAGVFDLTSLAVSAVLGVFCVGPFSTGVCLSVSLTQPTLGSPISPGKHIMARYQCAL